ncbi:hypothetical protein E0485_02130 [Paenibacillus albiflavus]|uniref:Lipoprotein n=1 Tax=Paenibacillus albiflavus TaxID=2545760 RepID=A0A4R4EM24_9BACL|nr:hypothetical protein [Paenibacillus albiflavus]TCZ81099.1 hypothetical protein E0485_02130 [Paenibacillus albiflavus]
MRFKIILTLLFCLTFTVITACSTSNKSLSGKNSVVSTPQPPVNNDADEREVNNTEFVSTLYSMNINDYNKESVSKIPFYSMGKIEYITEETVKSFQEGHHPWLGHAETLISIKASNLVPASYKKDDEIKKEFIQIKKLTSESALATIKFNDNFFYEVKAESSDITGGIFFITNIDFHTHIKEE